MSNSLIIYDCFKVIFFKIIDRYNETRDLLLLLTDVSIDMSSLSYNKY